jgi:hypothetical protein
MWTMFALASSYYKEYLLEGSRIKSRIEKVEVDSLKSARLALQNHHTALSDTANMLLIHHAILNPKLHQRHWTKYLYPLQYNGQQACLIMARHAIWLMCILPLTNKYAFQLYDYSFMGVGDEVDLTRVNGIIGTSR